jgi:hypothetical protein
MKQKQRRHIVFALLQKINSDKHCVRNRECMRPVWNIELSAQGDALLGAFNQVARIMLKPTAQCSCLLV